MHVGAGIPNIQRIHTDQQQEQDRAAVTVEPGVCGQAEQHWQLPQVHGHQVGPSLLLPLCVCLMSQTKMDLVGPAAPAPAASAASAAATAAASAAAASAATAAAAAAAAVTSRRLTKGVLLDSNSISTSVVFDQWCRCHSWRHSCAPNTPSSHEGCPNQTLSVQDLCTQVQCSIGLHAALVMYFSKEHGNFERYFHQGGEWGRGEGGTGT